MHCPKCEHSLRYLPARVAVLEKKFDDLVTKMEVAVTKAEPVRHVSQVDVAIKEAISAHDNRYHVVISGIQEADSPSHDVKYTKELFSFLDIGENVVFVDAVRLRKHAPDRTRPPILKVCFANTLQRSAVLRKDKLFQVFQSLH